MNEIAYAWLAERALQEDEREKTVCYLQQHISAFLKKNDRVLICFVNTPGHFGSLMEEAVVRCGAIAVIPDNLKWKTLLKEAFSKHCSVIVGTPLLVLGLTKLAKRMCTPLYARNVVLAGYPSAGWMIEGIRRGLDCKIWGCYDPGAGVAVSGFSCDGSGSVHLRSDVYGVEIVDKSGAPVADGELGEVVLYPVQAPEIRLNTGDYARLNSAPCPCGCQTPRLLDFDTVRGVDPVLSDLGEQLQRWTSVLDCRLNKNEYGVELEIVTFPGEKLPKLPSCAKLVIRNWNPETDVPFPHMFTLVSRRFFHISS